MISLATHLDGMSSLLASNSERVQSRFATRRTPRLTTKIASSRAELSGAFRLVFEAYVDRQLMSDNPYRMRVSPHHLLDESEVFVAVNGCQVSCTMTLVPFTDLGLPMQGTYPLEVDRRRRGGRVRVAEVTCLADGRHEGQADTSVVIRLMSLMAQCARHRGIDELLIEVHPRHADFYERFIGFERIGDAKLCSAVCNNPAVPLALDLKAMPVNHPRAYKRFFGKPFDTALFAPYLIPSDFKGFLSAVAEAQGSTIRGAVA